MGYFKSPTNSNQKLKYNAFIQSGKSSKLSEKTFKTTKIMSMTKNKTNSLSTSLSQTYSLTSLKSKSKSSLSSTKTFTKTKTTSTVKAHSGSSSSSSSASKARETYNRTTYSAYIKKGMNDVIASENIEKPTKKEFQCMFQKFEELPTLKELDKIAVSKCLIKVYEKDNKELHFLIVGQVQLRFNGFNYGFMDATSVDNAYKDVADVQPYVDFVKQLPAGFSLAMYTDESDAYNLKYIALKLVEADAALSKYLNILVANDISSTANNNLYPPSASNYDVDYIMDFTKPHSDLKMFKSYFTETWVLVDGSLNCAIDTTDNLPLYNNFMYNQNNTIPYYAKLSEHIELFNSATDEANVSQINPKLIYQCSIWHNIVPFSTNPTDLSYCGIGFGYGSRDSFVNINSVLMYIKETDERLCILKVRALQRFLTSKCVVGDEDLKNKCFPEASAQNEGKKDEESKAESEPVPEKPVDTVEEDKSVQPASGKVKLAVSLNNETLGLLTEVAANEPVLGEIKMDGPLHGPSEDPEQRLKNVIYTMILEGFDLDPKIYYSPELYRMDTHHYHPYILSKLEIEELQKTMPLEYEEWKKAEELKEIKIPKDNESDNGSTDNQNLENVKVKDSGNDNNDNNDKNKIDVNQAGSSATNTDSKINEVSKQTQFRSSNHMGERFIQSQTQSQTQSRSNPEYYPLDLNDKNARLSRKHYNPAERLLPVVNNKALSAKNTVEILKHWCNILMPMEFKGRGRSIGNTDVIYNDLLRFCVLPVKADEEQPQNQTAVNSSIGQKVSNDNIWYSTFQDKKKIVKRFKFGGSYNGDVLQHEIGCCMHFTSKRAGLIIEWCGDAMRYMQQGYAWKYVSVYGNTITERDFKGKTCLSDAELAKLRKQAQAEAKVHAYNGGIIIEQGDKETTITSDGKVINKDAIGSSTDTVKDSAQENKKDLPKDDTKNKDKNKDTDSATQPPAENDPALEPPVDIPEQPKNTLPQDINDAVADSPSTSSSSNKSDKNQSAPASNEPNLDNNLNQAPLSLNLSSKPEEKEKEEEEDEEPAGTGSFKRMSKPPAPLEERPKDVKSDSEFEIHSIGKYYDVWIDNENKVTVRTKTLGFNNNKVEKVVNAYKQKNYVYLHLDNGDHLKHNLDTGETLRYYSDKSMVEHIYPDASSELHNKNDKMIQMSNKYGISQSLNLSGNVLKTKVDKHFKYGNDTVFYLEDGTVMMKKHEGDTILINPDDTTLVIDPTGKVKTSEDSRFKLRYIVDRRTKGNHSQNKNNDLYVQDLKNQFSFKMSDKNKIVRNKNDGNIYEIVKIDKKNLKLRVRKDGSREFVSNKEKSICYVNGEGWLYDKQIGHVYLCKCHDNLISSWTCRKTVGLSYAQKVMQKKSKLWLLSHYNSAFILKNKKYDLDYGMLKYLKHNYKQWKNYDNRTWRQIIEQN